jgi:glycosyltransferase involved in cell wall biosynthesis
VVIDDGSTDGTAELASRAIAELFPEPDGAAHRERPRATVVANTLRAGKSGAIARGLAERRREELIVLTDADVVLEPRALGRLARAFQDPRVGMACGAQLFVDSLPADGAECADCTECTGGAGRAPAAGLYDRATSLVRALESSWGLLVSVHGQLLAWLPALGLEPTPGMAADDLDLMLQPRAGGAQVVRVAGARFHEVKTPAGPAREEQAVRRARAYVQFLRHPRIAELGRGGPLAFLQAWSYRRLPLAAPWLLPVAGLVLLQTLWLTRGPLPAELALLATALLLLSPPGRRLVDLLRVIVVATRRERAGGMTDVWETARH